MVPAFDGLIIILHTREFRIPSLETLQIQNILVLVDLYPPWSTRMTGNAAIKLTRGA